MTASIHSLERAKQRLGCNAKSAEHVFQNALSRGKTVDDFSGLERHYLKEKSTRGCELRVYNGAIYVIANGLVVTVYRTPGWFGKTGKRHKNGCRREWIEEDVA